MVILEKTVRMIMAGGNRRETDHERIGYSDR